MARLSPVSLLVLFLIFVIVLLSIDLHGKSSRLVKVVGLEPDDTAPDHRQLAAGPNPIALNDKVIYNRIPKTASTAFTHVLYDLAKVNEMYVIHVNTSVPGSNAAIMSLQDQESFRRNVTEWSIRPAFFHGHFAFLPFHRGVQPVYINLIRDPLERLVSYYYFLRFGDNYRKGLVRSKQGDGTTFNECVENQTSKDCTVSRMWLQVPYFCGQHSACWDPGSQWALDRAKQNLLDHYFIVGTTEKLGKFVQMLELHIPHLFTGAFEKITTQQPIRKTLHKDLVTNVTRAKLANTKVWRMEYDFYRFVDKNFDLLYKRSIEKNELRPKGYFYEKIYGPKGKIIK